MTSEMAENGGRNDAEQPIQDSTAKMIPKFSSFKAPPKLADRKDELAKGTKEDKSKRRHDDDRHHKHRHHRGDEDSSRSPSRHRDKRRRSVSPPPPPPPPARIESDLFKVDIKGDAANITYGISYRYSVPLFHRFGSGYILGLAEKWRIDRDKGEGKGIVVGVRGYEGNKRWRGGNMFAVDASRVGRLKAVEGVTKGFGADEEFVPISGRIEEPVEEEEERDYRSLEVKKPVEDVESVSSEDEETFSYSEELRQRTIELDRKIQSRPDDIQAWLDYAALQDDLAAGQKASTAEIKLGILQKGLEKNPGDTKLLVEIFKIESILLEPQKVLTHWQEILKKHETPELLLEYLNHRQTAFASFTYPEIVTTYAQTLATLRKLAYRATQQDRISLERTILYVLHRFARLARESGYNELGIACFQALIELNLFRPESAPSPTAESARDAELDRFEEFWDSECPRFGEEGAKGWRAWDPNESVDVPSAVKEISEDWYEHEEESKHDMPARTTDDLDDDPYRVILFNDLRPFLYAFTTDVVKQLSYAFISFCGINLPSTELSSNQITDPWLSTTFDFREFWPPPTNNNSIEWINGEVVEPERLSGFSTPFTFPQKIFPVDIDTLFPNDTWFGLQPSDLYSLNTQFLSTALHQLNLQDEHLIIIHLAIQNAVSPTTVLKLVKGYLKPRKTSLALYNVYALLLWQRSSFDEARKVWRMAIDMATTTHVNPILLWRTWIAAEFALDQEKARDLFGEMSDKVAVLGTGEMIVRKHLQENFERSLSFKLPEVEHYAFLIILLDYMTTGLDTAIQKCQTLANELQDKDMHVAQERVLLSTSKIIYHHTKVQGWYRIATLRDFWAFAIEKFPHNTAFLSLFTWNEANARIDGRVRKMFTSLEKNATVEDWIFIIWCSVTVEHGRTSPHATRALFEKALEKWYPADHDGNNVRKMSVVIWLLYVNWEAACGQPSRVKNLVFRAIRECPWSKDLALSAFGPMKELFDKRDMGRVYNVVLEKELRLHRELSSPTLPGGNNPPLRTIELPHDTDTDSE